MGNRGRRAAPNRPGLHIPGRQVFVDASGGRRRAVRYVMALAGLAFGGYLLVLGAGLFGAGPAGDSLPWVQSEPERLPATEPAEPSGSPSPSSPSSPSASPTGPGTEAAAAQASDSAAPSADESGDGDEPGTAPSPTETPRPGASNGQGGGSGNGTEPPGAGGKDR